MKFLIFGGTGFVGSQLRTLLEREGHEVEATSRSGAQGTLAVDITDAKSFAKITKRPDVIVNAASLIPQTGVAPTDPEFLDALFRTNVVGGVHICHWAAEQQVEKIFNLSTLVVVRKPWPEPLLESDEAIPNGNHAGYAMSKLSQEQLMNEAVKGSNVSLTHLRLSAVYGSTMNPEGILFFLLNRLTKNEQVTLTNATKVDVDFIHVKDVCQAVLFLSEEKVEESILNLASGTPISLFELAKLMKSLLASESEITNTNTGISSSKALVSIEKLNNYISKAGYFGTPLAQGLQELIDKKSK